MLSFLSKRERAAFESHIETLREEVHWLRSCLPWVVPTGAPVSLLPPQNEPAWGNLGGAAPTIEALSVSEEEEDIQAMLERGEIDTEEAQALLKTLGYANTEIEFG